MITVELNPTASCASGIEPGEPCERRRLRGGLRLILPHPGVLRRQVNVLAAIAAICVFWPLMVLVAIAIRLTWGRPVLERRTLIGVDRRWPFSEVRLWRRSTNRGGRPFTAYTFRVPWTGRGTPGAGSRRHEGRGVALGRLLRSRHLDELPLLFNVVRGDMNLVGPRAYDADRAARLGAAMPRWARRQRVLPGITGPAQVSLPRDAGRDELERELRLDLQYVDSQSIRQDLRIMLQTVRLLVAPRRRP